MRLLHLRIEGIGPFASPVSIDFSRFDASGIFLLEGPTGSGKSSIIDAITFALYGDVARLADASKDRLRSSYCAPTDPSRVECVFEVASGIYRVTRTPSFLKPGRKTKVNATVHLERVVEDETGVFRSVDVLSRSHAEADAEIASLVGLKKEQFLQTVILPQGKFATFLSARSEARREILQDVFGTHIYQTLQERFREAANEQAEAVDTARRAVDEARAHILELSALHNLMTSSDISPTSGAPLEETALVVPTVEEDSRADHDTTDPGEADRHAAQPSVPGSETDDEEILSRLAEFLGGQEERLSVELTRAKETLTLAREEEQRARQAVRDLATRDALTERLADLDSRESEMAALRQELSGARHAEAVRPFIDDFDASYERLRAAYSAVHEAFHSLVQDGTPEFPLPEPLSSVTKMWQGVLTRAEQMDPQQGDPLSLLRTHNADNAKHRTRISDLLPLEEGLVEREGALTDLQHRISQNVSSLEATETLIAELPGRYDQAEASYAQACRLAENVPDLEERLEELHERLEHARTADTYEGRLPAAEQALDEAIRLAQKADGHARALRTAWMADAASALAAELEDDAPCPVCGSTLHPSPASAHSQGEAVSHAQVDEADSERQTADRTVQERRVALENLRALAYEARLNANGSFESLTDSVESLRLELERAQQAHFSLPTLSAAVDEIKAEQLRAQTLSVALREEAAALAEQYTFLDSSLEADHRRCQEAAMPMSSLKEREAALESRIAAVDILIEALTTWESIRDAFNASCARLSQALSCSVPARAYIAMVTRDQPLSDDTVVPEDHELDRAQHAIDQCRRHLRSADDRAALEEALETYQTAVTSTREGLKNPAFASLTGEEDNVLKACHKHLHAAEDAHTRAVAQHERAVAHGEALGRAITKFRRTSSTLESVVLSAEPARRLHALASATTSENLSRTPLAAWVLMARFEEVLSAANPRLLAISQGRYELIRVDDDGSQSRKSGLGVAVIDHDTDTTRLPSTLSGGETFYVSLSLALGLADVVTGENGGIELRTMFIDEGFGSLDATTLDVVMTQLQRLRDSGRTVGVISHVHEMSTLIPDQIQVRWDAKKGSRVTIRA